MSEQTKRDEPTDSLDWNTSSRLANVDSSTPIDPKALVDGMVEIWNKLGGKKPDRLIEIPQTMEMRHAAALAALHVILHEKANQV